MQFDPSEFTAKKTYKLLEPGKYQFRIDDATETYSKKGNPMFKIKFHIFNEAGDKGNIYDYLLNNNVKRIKSLCEAIGEEDKFNAGKLECDDLIKKYGQCEIDIEKGKNGYSDSNQIKFYYKQLIKPQKQESFFPEDEVKKNRKICTLGELENEDIPF